MMSASQLGTTTTQTLKKVRLTKIASRLFGTTSELCPVLMLLFDWVHCRRSKRLKSALATGSASDDERTETDGEDTNADAEGDDHADMDCDDEGDDACVFLFR